MECRDSTLRHHQERLNRVLVYIQEHIDGPLSLQTLAEIACFSPYHFHRIFQAHVGETLSDYVRRTRLEKAAQQLRYTAEPVTAIALAVGYDTPAAFTKAFRQYFGKSPSEFKKTRSNNYPLTSKPHDEGREMTRVTNMVPEIRTRVEQKVLFVRKTGRYDQAASAAWSTLMQFADARGLITKNTLCIGLSYDNPEITIEEKLRYDACITADGNSEPEGEVGTQMIHSGTYAVFLHKGSYEKLGDTYHAIFSQWLPASGEKLRDLPCFDVYLNDPRRTKPEQLKTEIWIPID